MNKSCFLHKVCNKRKKHLLWPDFAVTSADFWSWMRDSNSRPHDYESGALPAELIQRSSQKAQLY